MPNFIIVGPGRAGLSFRSALTTVGWHCDGVIDRAGLDDDTAAGLTSRTDVVLLTVPDDQVTPTAARIRPGPSPVVHVSGAKGLDVLAPHEQRGSVHPLMSLPDATTGSERLLSGAAFAVAGHPVAAAIVKALGGRAVTIDDEQRAQYHAGAVVAANHLVALCAQVERLAGSVGMPLDAYWDLMETTLDNVRRSGAVSSLTGPAARGDSTTLAAHLDALAPGEHELYVTLATEAARLAGTALPPEWGAPVSASTGRPAITRPTIVTTISELRRLLDDNRGQGRSVGFVPTMGYLHDGHGSLMRAASAANDLTVASIFVNPLQFAPDEDLASYPRDLDHDAALAASNGVEVLFVPEVSEMYPHGPVLTTVSVPDLARRWEGESRPTHFAGVATVVSKLFNIVGRCRAYFGEKDYQQLAIIRRMASDLSIPVEVVGCPIVREPDGLAMSSRNVYLEGADRTAAIVLRRALDEGERAVSDGERDPAAVVARMEGVVADEPRAALDYAAAVDPNTLEPPEQLGASVRLLIAARLGTTRLIDNCGVDIGSARSVGQAT